MLLGTAVDIENRDADEHLRRLYESFNTSVECRSSLEGYSLEVEARFVSLRLVCRDDTHWRFTAAVPR